MNWDSTYHMALTNVLISFSLAISHTARLLALVPSRGLKGGLKGVLKGELKGGLKGVQFINQSLSRA